jgi:hypothetical protein
MRAGQEEAYYYDQGLQLNATKFPLGEPMTSMAIKDGCIAAEACMKLFSHQEIDDDAVALPAACHSSTLLPS